MSTWPKEFPAEVVVCDTTGIILEMNDEAETLFAEDGGRGLLGANVLDEPNTCQRLLQHRRQRDTLLLPGPVEEKWAIRRLC
jgi:PAS domain-containing protein